MSNGRLAGKLALVTGASRGLGRAVAELFAAEGAHVVAVARTVGGLEELDDAIKATAQKTGSGGSATLVPVDLTDFAAIDRIGLALYERFKRLDVLAGIAATLGVLSPLGHVDPPLWQQTMDTNATANWRLIRAMDPLLRAAPAGRAIFVTAAITRQALPYWGPYAVSKAALEKLVGLYAAEVAHTKVRVNLVDPGPMRTKLRAQAFPGEDPMTVPPPQDLAPAFLPLAEESCSLNGQWIAADEWLRAKHAPRQ
jgi:NAD(P)-dependent dehydrogenase (short-subunit alcohol dehydrogenase family)